MLICWHVNLLDLDVLYIDLLNFQPGRWLKFKLEEIHDISLKILSFSSQT